MREHRPLAIVFASGVLGLAAVAAVAGSLFIFFGAWMAYGMLGGWTGQFGALSAVLVGVLTLFYGALAAFAARDVWLGRDRGRALGITAGLLAIVGPIVAILVSPVQQSWQPLMYLAIGIGVAIVAPLLLPGEGRRIVDGETS